MSFDFFYAEEIHFINNNNRVYYYIFVLILNKTYFPIRGQFQILSSDISYGIDHACQFVTIGQSFRHAQDPKVTNGSFHCVRFRAQIWSVSRPRALVQYFNDIDIVTGKTGVFSLKVRHIHSCANSSLMNMTNEQISECHHMIGIGKARLPSK